MINSSAVVEHKRLGETDFKRQETNAKDNEDSDLVIQDDSCANLGMMYLHFLDNVSEYGNPPCPPGGRHQYPKSSIHRKPAVLGTVSSRWKMKERSIRK